MSTSADETAQAFPPAAYAWYVVFVIFLADIFAFIDRALVGILTPALEADLGISDSQAGLLQGVAFALFYALFGLPLGWIADRWSRKWLLTIGVSVWSFASAMCGVARGFGFLFLARLGVGMGEGTVNPCGISLIGDYFPPRTRARAYGVHVMGSAVGNGLTFLFGGLLLTWLTVRGGLDLPNLGHAKPWQAMFVLVGLGGLLPAILFMVTVREPRRREVAQAKTGGASWAQIRAFIAQNRVTLFCHHAGIALTSMTTYAFLNWMPTFFLRVHGWTPQQFSVTYGTYQVVFASASSLAAGMVASWLKARGVADANWRICAIGAIGVVVCAALAPVVSSPQLALGLFLASGCMMAFPGTMTFAIIAEVAPNEMRGFIAAMYYLVQGQLATGLGPLAVGLVTDHVFHDKAAIGRSLLVVTLAGGIPACLLLVFGLRAFRLSLSRAIWLDQSDKAA